MGYRYRKFALGEHTIVARTELHGLVEWRQKIDSQRGAVFATELKNNSCKLAKWTAQSLIAGAEQMKIGFVSRTNRTNRYEHTVLGTQSYKPRDFAGQITLGVPNVWGIIRMLCELFMKREDGKFVILRD